MSGKSINFEDKKINKSSFYKNKKLFSLNDIDVNKISVSKKESYGTKIHINTSLHIMMVMLLDHYVYDFLRRLVMLNTLIVIRQCPLRLMIISY